MPKMSSNPRQSRRKSKKPKQKKPAAQSVPGTLIPSYLRPVQPTAYHQSAHDYYPSSAQPPDAAAEMKPCKEAAHPILSRTPPHLLMLEAPPVADADQSSACIVSIPLESVTVQAVCKKNALQKINDATFAKDGIEVTMHHADVWNSFYEVGNEMIVTKPGRRMFPTLLISVDGLVETTNYSFDLRINSCDEHRYKYLNNRWVPLGISEIIQDRDRQVYKHPKNSKLGSFWEKKPISFLSCKITHNPYSKFGHILLYTMHKYVLEIVIRNMDENIETCIELPNTQFITVTAYLNSSLTELKIFHNPFAKGFRESSKHDTALVSTSNCLPHPNRPPPSYMPPITSTPQPSDHFIPPQPDHFIPPPPLVQAQQPPQPQSMTPPLLTSMTFMTPPDTPSMVVGLGNAHPQMYPSSYSAPQPSTQYSFATTMMPPPSFTTATNNMFQQEFPLSYQWQQENQQQDQYPLPDEASLTVTEDLDLTPYSDI